MVCKANTFRSKEEWEQEYREGAHWENSVCPFLVDFAADLPQGARIFDAGCGSGRHSIYLAEKGFQVTGQDFSKTAIDKARNNAERGKQIDFIEGDLERLDHFSTHYFDAIYCGYVIPNLDTNCILPQFHRILKPEGTALFAVLYETLYDPPCKFDHVVDLDGLRNQIGAFFRVISLELNDVEEVDQHGLHRHKRAIFQLIHKDQ